MNKEDEIKHCIVGDGVYRLCGALVKTHNKLLLWLCSRNLVAKEKKKALLFAKPHPSGYCCYSWQAIAPVVSNLELLTVSWYCSAENIIFLGAKMCCCQC